MDSETKLVIPAQVMSRQVGDETVILDLGSGMYFGLDPVGARIRAWSPSALISYTTTSAPPPPPPPLPRHLPRGDYLGTT